MEEQGHSLGESASFLYRGVLPRQTMVVPWGSWHMDQLFWSSWTFQNFSSLFCWGLWGAMGSEVRSLPKKTFLEHHSSLEWDQILPPESIRFKLFSFRVLPHNSISPFFCSGQRAEIISARGTLPSRTKRSQMPPKDHFSPVRSCSITCNIFWWCTAAPWVLFKELTRVGEHYVDLFALSWVIANQEALLGITGLYFTVMERWYHYTNPFSSDGMIVVYREPCDPYPQDKMLLYRPQEPRN